MMLLSNNSKHKVNYTASEKSEINVTFFTVVYAASMHFVLVLSVISPYCSTWFSYVTGMKTNSESF